jgi:hypothetical protein
LTAPDFVIFQAGFPDLQVSAEARPPTRETLEKLAETAVAACRKKMFDYAPIDSNAIAALAGKNHPGISSIPSLAAALLKAKPSAIEEQLLPLCKMPPKPADECDWKKWGKRKKGIMEIAFSRYLNALYEKAVPPLEIEKGKFAKKEIRLAANTVGWVAVKKVSLEATPEEALACLAGIHATVLRKMGETSGATAVADGLLKAFAPRNSLGALAQALSSFDAAGARSALEAACGKHLRAGEDFLYCSFLERFGHAPFVTTEAIGMAFPQLKIPKPRGRIAGASAKAKK